MFFNQYFLGVIWLFSLSCLLLSSLILFFSCLFLATTVGTFRSWIFNESRKQGGQQQHISTSLSITLTDSLHFESDKMNDWMLSIKPNCFWLPSKWWCFSQNSFFFTTARACWFQNLTPTQRYIISFACQAVQILELSLMQKVRREVNHLKESGEDQVAFAKTLLEEKIPCLMEYKAKNPTCSYGPSLRCTENQTLVPQAVLPIRVQWVVVLSRKPHPHWSRWCGTFFRGNPSTTRKVPVNPDLVQASKT